MMFISDHSVAFLIRPYQSHFHNTGDIFDAPAFIISHTRLEELDKIYFDPNYDKKYWIVQENGRSIQNHVPQSELANFIGQLCKKKYSNGFAIQVSRIKIKQSEVYSDLVESDSWDRHINASSNCVKECGYPKVVFKTQCGQYSEYSEQSLISEIQCQLVESTRFLLSLHNNTAMQVAHTKKEDGISLTLGTLNEFKVNYQKYLTKLIC